MNSKNKTRVLVSVAMLSAISYVLAFIELPVPLSPSFAKMDTSDLPALIAAFAFGPVSGIAVECGSVAMAIAAGILNYFVLLPLYENFMPIEQVITAFGEFIPFIKTKLDVVLWNAGPFNLLKGIAISAITMLIYLTPVLKGRYEHDDKRIFAISQK